MSLGTVACKGGLVLATGGLAVAGLERVPTGAEWARLGVTGVLGLIALTFAWALRKVYVEKREDAKAAAAANEQHVERLYRMIDANTAANQSAADALRSQTAVMVEVKDAIMKCRRSG